MNDSFDLAALKTETASLLESALVYVVSWEFGIQALAVFVALVLSMALAPRLRSLLSDRTALHRMAAHIGLERGVDALHVVAVPLLWIPVQGAAIALLLALELPVDLLNVTSSLLIAWVVIRIASALATDAVWSTLISILVWTVAALAILDVLEDTITFLDSLALTLGGVRISVFGVFKAFLTLVALLWIGGVLARIFDRRVGEQLSVTPSVRLLLTKLLRVTLFAVAIFMAISALGIDLTALALFGGAVGIGVGLGLQPIVGNLVSGVILLLDRSIKPGDVITVGQTFGWVESLEARYASVRTRDGIEHLIPNEELITSRVENWSHSDRFIRLRAEIGVSYRSDVRRAIELCLQAANAVERVVADPKPNCLLRGFGDSALNLELRIWIQDPENGRANVMSEVLLHVWDLFHEHGVEIPFPQRDLHLRSADVLPVRLEEPREQPG